MKDQSFATRLVTNAVIGGTVSAAAGGNFGNGAVTAAFGYLFNDMAACMRPGNECQLQGPGRGGDFPGIGAGLGLGALAAAIENILWGPVVSSGQPVYDLHGNDLNSRRPTWVYELFGTGLDNEGDTLKFGITSRDPARTRYSEPWYRSNEADMNPLVQFSDRQSARIYEKFLCTNYVITNGKLPSMSKTC
jgi:hypothetical protein